MVIDSADFKKDFARLREKMYGTKEDKYKFVKDNPNDIVFLVEYDPPVPGLVIITIDKKHMYNLNENIDNVPSEIYRQFRDEYPNLYNLFKKRRSI